METNERIIDFIKSKGLSISSFEKSIGKATNYIRNSKSFTSNVLSTIMDVYPDLNIEWLITGKGDMLKGEEDKISSVAAPESSINYRFVPLLNLDAVGGMHRTNKEAGDAEYPEELIPFADAREGDFCLHVSGDSMAPTCPSGSLVLVREVERWKEYFGYGNIFVILLDDGRRILKEVQKYIPDSKDYVLCRSHNEKYPEEELPKSLIKGVFKVIKIQSDRGW